MSMPKRFFITSVAALLVSVVISFGFNSSNEVKVPSGFAFGPAVAQQNMQVPGVYRTKSYGFPATYREISSFRSTSGSYYETSYDSKPFTWPLVVVNVVFWMSLFTVVWLPIASLQKSQGGTHFFTSKKGHRETTVVENENNRD